MAKELGGREGGGFEESIKCDETAEVKVRSAEEIKDDIQSTPTVIWDPFAILPKEIYVKIFNKLDNPMDKQNFMNAHVKWYELLKAERVKFLFGKVFEDLLLLPEKMWMPSVRKDDQSLFGRLALPDEDISDGIADDDGKTEDPSVKERIRKAKYINLTRLRLVCRDWDKSIQNYYQLHPDHFQFVFCEDKWIKDSKQLKNQYPNGYFINELAAMRLKTDLDEFRGSHPPSKNPFLTRKVRIRLDTWWSFHHYNEQFQRLLSQIRTLFETYGQHVWHFSIWTLSTLSPEKYLKIVKWLKLMPELRTLQIKFEYDLDIELMCETNEFIKLSRTELPKMKKLQTFHVSGFPHSAFNKFLEGMTVVEKVEVAAPPRLLKGFKFPTTLTELALTLSADEEILHLNSLEQFPVVRKLIIDFEFSLKNLDGVRNTQPSLETVLKAIEGKFPALEDLHLGLPRTSCDKNKYKLMKQSLYCRLNLKKLKRLSLTFPTLSSLDFLQEIKTLQELKIELDSSSLTHFEGSHNLVRRQRIKFFSDVSTMWKSNIWQVFPNLRKLSIRGGFGRGYHLYKK